MKPVLQLSSLELARKRIVCVHIVFLCGNGCSFFLLLIASSRWCFIIFSRNSLPDHLILPWVLPQAAGCMAGWMVVGWPFSRSGFIHAVALRSFAREGSGYCSCGSRKGVKIMLVQNFGIHFRWNTYRDKDTLHHQTIFFWKLPLQRWIDPLFHLYTSPKLYSSFQVREDASTNETVQSSPGERPGPILHYILTAWRDWLRQIPAVIAGHGERYTFVPFFFWSLLLPSSKVRARMIKNVRNIAARGAEVSQPKKQVIIKEKKSCTQ